MKIIELKKVDSTNDYCKLSDKGEDLIVIAESQTAGRGTKGRSFSADIGGLYLSIMRHHKRFPAEHAFKIMINACVAVCKTVEAFGANPQIRWANDVLADGKKICGTLIENTFSGAYISRSIVGIGINVNNDLPEELKEIATTLHTVTGKSLSVESVKNILIKNLEKQFTVTDYKNYIDWFNKPIKIINDGAEFSATALDISDDGRLEVLIDGELQKISSAEVSLRL